MKYSLKEILDIAIAIEQAGREFYSFWSEKSVNDDVKSVFSFLSDEEFEHKKRFEAMLSEAGNFDGIFTEEYYLYLKAIGSTKIFGDEPLSGSVEIESSEDAVKKAFLDEKQSILFYSEIRELYSQNRKEYGVLDSIIQEERRHVATLIELLEMIRLSKS